MLEVFEKCGANSYQKSRAIMATLFNAAMLANNECTRPFHEIAEMAVTSADAMLAELGISDPDRTV